MTDTAPRFAPTVEGIALELGICAEPGIPLLRVEFPPLSTLWSATVRDYAALVVKSGFVVALAVGLIRWIGLAA